MDLQEESEEGHTVGRILDEESMEIAGVRRNILPSDTRSHSEQNEDEGSLGSLDVTTDETTTFYNLNIAVDIVETDYQDVEREFADSIVEINGAKVFPCSKCNKICKSKGGLTKHNNSKHSVSDKDSSAQNTTPLCLDTMKSIVETIKRNIISEQLYGDEIERTVKNISASEALFKEVLPLYTKFCRKKNQDKLLEEFYGLMLNSSTLLNCNDSRVANLVMIHIPDHLVGFCNVGRVAEKPLESTSADYEIQPSEHGPLSYIVGYVLSKLIKASKGKLGEEKPELQSLLQSLVLHEGEGEANEFIAARTRGGLVTPCEDIVRILHEAEICFRKDVKKTDIIRNISVDAICFSAIHLPIVKSLWENIVLCSGVDPSSPTNKLCLENIVKLFLKVRSFSYTKDYVTQYKIKEKQRKKKGLRKDLKQSSEEV